MKKLNKQKLKRKKGQAIIIATIFFSVLSALLSIGLGYPAVTQLRVSNDLTQGKQSYFLAESGVEDVVYRLSHGLTVDASESLSLNGETAVTVTTDSGGGKIVEAEGDWKDYVRTLQATLTAGTGVAFNYGVQSGQGGFYLDNNASVTGNVYSNGDIVGSSNTFITGTAIAANSAALTTDQSNASPLPAPNSINFRNTSGAQDFAQSFQLSTTSPINKIEFNIKKTGSPSNATVKIVTDSSGSPGTIVLDSATLTASLVTTNFGWVTATFTTNVLLTEGTTYWVVVDNGSQSSSNYYTISANTSYANGLGKTGQLNGTWNNTSPVGLDGYFKIYLGGITSTISNIDIGTGSIGNAHANTVNNTKVYGTLYCQTGSGNKNGSNNNISCNTSLADPAPQDFPISEANIDQWKADAEAGGVISGDHTLSGGTSTLGPKKITGNLTIEEEDVIINGTIWVVGNIIVPNNANIRLASGYGTASGIIIADGYISLDNNADFFGSGQSGSNILLMSTSACPDAGNCGGKDAIEIFNNVGLDGDNLVVYAHNGTIDFNNNAGVKSATGYKIHLSNNVTIIYESGLINTNFSSGPGGAWNIVKWQEVE